MCAVMPAIEPLLHLHNLMTAFVQVERPQSIIGNDCKALIRNDGTLGRLLLRTSA